MQSPILENDARPRFTLFAGICGVIIYILGTAPFILILSSMKAAQLSTQVPEPSTSEITDEVSRYLEQHWVLVVALVLQCVIFLTYAYLISRIRGTGSLRKDLGITFSPRMLWFVLLGIAVQIIGIFISFPIQLLKDGDDTEQTIVTSFRESRGIAFIFLIVLIALVVPVIEEICFRGLLLRGTNKLMRPVFSVLFVSFLFMGIHFSDPNALYGAPSLFLVSIVATSLAMYRGKIDASIAVHIGFNMTTAFLIIALG